MRFYYYAGKIITYQGPIQISERETKRETINDKSRLSFLVSYAFIVSRIQIMSFVSRFVSRPIFLVYRFTYTNYKSSADEKRKTVRETKEIYRRLRADEKILFGTISTP